MIEIILLVILIILVVAVLAVFLLRKPVAPTIPDNTQGLQLLQSQLQELSRVVDAKMSDSTKMMQIQHGQSAKIISEVTEKLTKLDETNKQVIGFADQLQNLQDILKNPKQRGILGEYYLETLLKNVLPPGSFQMQYTFGNGEIVDAVVFVKDKIIPIDSKFSLENYNRLAEEKNEAEKVRLEKVFVEDLKKRINETAKYIRPSEGTMDFAFMFIPHEAIYYDLLINKIGAVSEDTENLIQRAANKHKVIIISPTSFLAYLQTVLQGLKALQIEETAKDIIKRVEDLGRHIRTYEDYHSKMGNAIGTVVNHYNKSSSELKKIDKDVVRVTGNKTDSLEITAIEKPREED
ncbi:MAG: DNA recombination protein RmuC [Patescibacteria group bacterium]